MSGHSLDFHPHVPIQESQVNRPVIRLYPCNLATKVVLRLHRKMENPQGKPLDFPPRHLFEETIRTANFAAGVSPRQPHPLTLISFQTSCARIKRWTIYMCAQRFSSHIINCLLESYHTIMYAPRRIS
jgi:hypothetical protein